MRNSLKMTVMLALISLTAFLFAGTCGDSGSLVQPTTLTVAVSGDGDVTLNPPGGTYEPGTQVTLTATPAPGGFFIRWEGDLTGTTSPATLTMDANKQVTAVFATLPNLSGKGAVVGQVSSIDGVPIPAVGVTLANGMSASTDDYGFYAFSLPEGYAPTIVAHFAKNGFAPISKALTIQPTETARPVPIHMAPADQTVTLDSSKQNTTRTAKSAVTIPANALADASGQPVTGSVDLTVTHLDPSTNAVLAFPGSFGDAQDTNGQQVALESFGFASYQLTQNGQPVNLAQGTTATIEYVLPPIAQVTYHVGDKIGLWEFDHETATWKETGQGEVRLASDGSGQLAWFAEVPHFSDWNCDKKEERHCITGQVVMDAPDPLAPLTDEPLAPLVPQTTPVAGATVIATGISYSGTDSSITDSNGNFCVYAKSGSTCSIEIRVNGSPAPTVYQVNGASQNFTKNIVYVPDGEAQCGGGDCVNMGQIQIPVNSAVKGKISDKNGMPASNVKVHLSSGASAITDANGEFCAKAPAGMQVYVYAEGWSATMVTTPDNATCDNGNAVETELNIPLPAPDDALGTLTASKLVSYYVFNNQVDTMPMFGLSGSFLLRDASAGQSFSIAGATVIVENHDPCSVTVFDYITTYQDGENPTMLTPGAHALDPGNPGTASNGAAQVQLVRDDSVDTAALWSSGYFRTSTDVDLLTLGFNAGQTINFSFPGGVDIGAFSTSITMPADLVVTSPNLLDPNATISLTAPLNLTWVAGNPADSVEVMVIAGDSAYDDNPDGSTTVATHSVDVHCIFPDTGSGVVSTDLLSRLPVGTQHVTLMVLRTRQNQIDVSLKSAGGTGKLNVEGQTGVTRTFTLP